MECDDNFLETVEDTWKNILNEWPVLKPETPFKNFPSFKPGKFTEGRKLDNHFKCTVISCLFDWILDIYRFDLEAVVIPKFWAQYDDAYDDEFFGFPKAVDMLYQDMKKYLSIARSLQASNIVKEANESKSFQRMHCRSLTQEMLKVLQSLLFNDAPNDFWHTLTGYFDRAFKAFHGKQKGIARITRIDDRSICGGCDQRPRSCGCEQYLSVFYKANKQLYELQLLNHTIGSIPISVAQDNVEAHIHQLCVKKYEVSFLPILKNWLQDIPLKWLGDIFLIEENNSEELRQKMHTYKERLLHALYSSYADVRLDQLFNIIIEFPDSKSAIADLRECMEVTDLRPKLISELRATIKKRLLHPGVNTADILTAYIFCIKALRELDPSSVILQLVGEPISKYLRTRDDTVRCAVSGFTDDSFKGLSFELMKITPVIPQDDYASDDEYVDWQSWMPDPIDADPSRAAKAQRCSDIINMLVNIYGTKEVFVNEYRTLLADRLLNSFSFNTKKEIRHLELLKLRFGESQMHFCDVMLKDIADSKRINTRLNSEDVPELKDRDFPVNAMILSAQFWPPFKEEKFKLPDYIWQHLQMYTSAFEALKGNRTLVWKPHLGQVNIEIELKEKKFELSVSPIYATILWHFQDQPEWTIEELSSKMEIQASVLRRKITYWQSHGLLREREPDVFTLIEEHQGPSQESVVVIEEEMESVAASSLDQREEELQTFWSYIVGMLTNMESLSLERIHSMLRMFAMQGTNTNEFTLQGMKQFLDKKVKERKLVYSGGLYRLPRGE